MISVVIAAHDEAAVIARCLDALLADPEPGTDPDPTADADHSTDPSLGRLDITVVANGCTDRTAEVARTRRGVRVIERPLASKPDALNAGDAAAVGFPRIYLDADVVLSGADLRRLAAAVADPHAGHPPVLAAAPRRRLVLTGRPAPVRAYYAVHARLPAMRAGLYGRGAIAVSAAARARFDQFPGLIADDLFLDSLFTEPEKREVAEVSTQVATPLRTRDLLRRLARVRAGNAALRTTEAGVRPASRLSWLRDVVLPHPRLAPAAACYIVLTLTAAGLARHGRGPRTWGRDASSRTGER